MAQLTKIPFAALTDNSILILRGINTNTRAYGSDGKPIDGVKGEPKIEIAVLDTLDHFTVTCKTLEATLAAVTEEQVAASLKSRKYICIALDDAFAKPRAASGGYGVVYSVKADSARIATPKPAAPTPADLGKTAKTTTV